MKGEGHLAGYLYGTECACSTGRCSVFPPSFKFSSCLITMDVFSLRFFCWYLSYDCYGRAGGGSYSGLFVGYRVHISGQVFPGFLIFL